jgi:tetratricopeptide (TPR) repeat protein
MGDWNWPAAEAEFERAIGRNPNDATAHYYYAYFLASVKRFDAAIDQIRQAQILDPLSSIINTCLGTIHVFARQFDRAIGQLLKTLELDPHFALAYFWLSFAYEQSGMYKEALDASHQAVAPFKGHPEMMLSLGRAYVLAGQRAEAQRTVDQVHELAKTRYVSPYYFVPVYVALNDPDRAFAWLERSYRERPWWMVLLNVDPRLDPIRTDPRFLDLTRRVGLG